MSITSQCTPMRNEPEGLHHTHKMTWIGRSITIHVSLYRIARRTALRRRDSTLAVEGPYRRPTDVLYAIPQHALVNSIQNNIMPVFMALTRLNYMVRHVTQFNSDDRTCT